MALQYLEIIQKGSNIYGHVNGFLYTVSSTVGDKKYWKCRRKSECTSRLITINQGRNVVIRKGGEPHTHSHPPNPEEVQALRLISSVKRAVTEHPERPPISSSRHFSDANNKFITLLPNTKSTLAMNQNISKFSVIIYEN